MVEFFFSLLYSNKKNFIPFYKKPEKEKKNAT
jgi:hypothetical protein